MPLTLVPPSPASLAKIEAALESGWITFVSIAGGMYLAAVAAGATTPQALWAYLRANWVVWLGTNLIAPAIRAYRQPPPVA